MLKIRIENVAGEPVGLEVEPLPERVVIQPAQVAKLNGSFLNEENEILFRLHRDQDGLTIVLWSAYDFDAVVTDPRD